MSETLTDILIAMSGNLVALKQIQDGMVTTFDHHFRQLGEVLAMMERHRQSAEARHTEMLRRMDERLAKQDDILARMDARLARQDEILARINETTRILSQILSRFEQGRNGH